MNAEKLPAVSVSLQAKPTSSHITLARLGEHIAVSDIVTLRKLVPEDALAIFDLVMRNPDMPTQVAFAKDITKVGDVIPSLQSRSNDALDGRYAIEVQNELVGSIWTFPGYEEGEFGLGYCLDSTSRGGGIVTKSVKKIIEELRLLGARQVYFQIIIGNEDSVAIPRRLGCVPAERLVGTDFPVEQQRWRLQLTD